MEALDCSCLILQLSVVRHKDDSVAQGSHSLVPCQGAHRGWGMQMEGVVRYTGKVEVVVVAHYIGTAGAAVTMQDRLC